MTPADWAALVATVIGLASTLFMGLRWLVRSFLFELKPNGGSSMKDSMARMETRIDDLYKLIAEK